MTTTTTPNLARPDLPQADQTAIIGTLMALQQGFARRDADALGAVYAPDADWVNAFGTTKQGAVDIVDHLRGLFADANFDAGTVVSGPDGSWPIMSEMFMVANTVATYAGHQ